MDPIKLPLHGGAVEPLKIIEDDRGAVLHMLRQDSDQFTKFGEIYFSEVNPGVVKAWKRHRKMTQLFAAPRGTLHLALYDARENSPTYKELREYELGRPDHYQLIKIPPGVWYGFENTGQEKALIANCADMPHDPQESETLPLESGPVKVNWRSQTNSA
ncbi:MAG: dTDP-4-dehydrorhamnose 3,5-epimerase [Candidatus Nitrohelix vancouverensis]|uniref:dTDP-4-dehydrorhamnose 3,5-epimerase n=1 Tax=Candidatus Nitrohelix vancouverensis TaxID=2705534 RepID=A0A7T0C067_9BACT|nr:MAG: dTDP-4-dehydrorhamnose 3,5-epimerase [Candidatus Nitrohelix vancouverensis]